MKEANLSVSIKRVCRTTRSLEAPQPWGNRIQNLDIGFRCAQVWVGDITYVRLKSRFIYVCVLMDVFTRMIRGNRQVSQHLTQSLTLKPLQDALHQSVPEIHHSDQGVQYLSTAYISTLKEHGIEISLARRGCPWENGYAEKLIRTLKEEEVHRFTEFCRGVSINTEEIPKQKQPTSDLCKVSDLLWEGFETLTLPISQSRLPI